MQPCPIAGILRQKEQVEGEPNANHETQDNANDIARCFVERPDVFELWAGNPSGDHDENADKKRSNGQPSEPNQSGPLGVRKFLIRRVHWRLT